MERIKFIIALWAGKFFTWLFKHIGREKDDRPGMLSLKICLKFLTYVKKPKLTICVSGTNGKTSISLLLADIFKKEGYRVAVNEWGANANAGHARLLLDAVDIFNRSTKDVAVIETDEMLSTFSLPQLKPNYFIVNNLGRDSMFSNANPEYIMSHIKQAVAKSKDTVMIINADDPLCSALNDDNQAIYFGVDNIHAKKVTHVVDDFSYCFKCHAKPIYNYRNYRHVGDYYCPNCGLKACDRDYLVTDFNDEYLEIKEIDGLYRYPVISDALHNIYNTVTIISLLRNLGYRPDKIAELLSSVQITKTRETNDVVNGIELLTRASKGQNPSSASTIIETLVNTQGNKELILLYDETLPPGHFETVAWIYDTDFENLNDPGIKKIIIAGDRYLDHRLRLLLAGVDKEKIVAVKDPKEITDHLIVEGIDKIIIVHDILLIQLGQDIKQAIKTKLSGGK